MSHRNPYGFKMLPASPTELAIYFALAVALLAFLIFRRSL